METKRRTISFKIEIEREGEKIQKQFTERETKTPKFRHYNMMIFSDSLKRKISTNSLNMQGLATWQDFEQGYP
jgi:hypothetical protein